MLTRFFSSIKEFQNPFSIQGLDFALILLICSKFYFLWGFSVWPQPAAPVWIILLRDVICWGTLGWMWWQCRRQNFFRGLPFFFALLALGTLISLVHVFEGKGLSEWVQHYLRNTLFPLLFYPAAWLIFRSQKKIEIRKIFVIATALNVLVSLVQLRFFPQLMWGGVRPTGLIGDPLIMSVFILLGCFASLSLGAWVAAPLIVTSAYVLIFTSSLSAMLSFFAGLGVLALLAVSFQNSVRKNLRRFGLVALAACALVMGLGIWTESKVTDQQDLLIPKAQALVQSIFCVGDKCERHASYLGRIRSYRMALELCEKNKSACLLGDYQGESVTKVDSTLASLILNWGIGFALLALSWVLWHFRLLWIAIREKHLTNSDDMLWALIFLGSLFYSLFNSLMYKYPLNIFFYMAMAYIHERASQARLNSESSRSQTK